MPSDADDVDSNCLPTSQLMQRTGQMKGMRKQGLSSCNSLIYPQALQLMRPQHQHRSTREALSEDTAAARYNEVERKGGVLSPKYAERLFFSSSLFSWSMQFLHTLGELINFKAGWVSKVNDLIIFPASLLRSQLSGSGKWGCGPLWRLRSVCVCVYVFVCLCFFVSFYIKRKEIEKLEGECVSVYML